MADMNFLATDPITGDLSPIPHCWLRLPDSFFDDEELEQSQNLIHFYSLPEIADAHTITWNTIELPGRPVPVKTYGGTGDRSIELTIHLYVTKMADIKKNRKTIRVISALTYPTKQFPSEQYMPPYICRLRMANMLSEDELGLPVILESYTLSYGNTTQWFFDQDLETYMPLHVALGTSWDVAYSWEQLPGAEDVVEGNY